jgi:hypothetical protein
MTYIFKVSENLYPYSSSDSIYVRTTDDAIRNRQFIGGFKRFNYEIYDYTDPGDVRTEIDGQKIMNIKEFDKWRKDHGCC